MRQPESVYQRRFRERLKQRGVCHRCKGAIGEDGTKTMCKSCRRALALQVRIRYHVSRAMLRMEGGEA